MHVAPDAVEPHPRVQGPIHVLACEEVLGLVIRMFVLVGGLLCEAVQVVDRRAHLEVLVLVLARAALALVLPGRMRTLRTASRCTPDQR